MTTNNELGRMVFRFDPPIDPFNGKPWPTCPECGAQAEYEGQGIWSAEHAGDCSRYTQFLQNKENNDAR